jgi:hypothetical protein
LIGAGVKVNIKGAWLSAEIVEVGAAMAELDGGSGVCIRFTDGDEHAESEEWHEYGTDEIAVLNTAVKERGRPPFGEDLVGAYVQAHVAGAWLDAVVVEVEAAMADHDGKDDICIQYADYPTADPEWHLYASEDILYREDPPTPEQRSLVDTPERFERVDETPEPDSPRVIHATPRDRPASPPGGIYQWYWCASASSPGPGGRIPYADAVRDKLEAAYANYKAGRGATYPSVRVGGDCEVHLKTMKQRHTRTGVQRDVVRERASIVSEWKKTNRAWPSFGSGLVGAAVKVHVDGASLAAEIIEIAAAMAELDGRDGVCLRFMDDAHSDEEWHEYGTEDVVFVRGEPVASPGSFFK